MKKTKLFVTIGPASEKIKMLKKLVLAGMNVMRWNLNPLLIFEEHELLIQKDKLSIVNAES